MLIISQKSFDTLHQAEMQLLLDTYPVGNSQLFPDKRIYKQPGTGYLFELGTIQLSSWASHMVSVLIFAKIY